ncbi:3-oxoacyl-[acyl-carrier-protein] synthase II [Rhizobium mesoamericanum]|uniref:beta-ketoacyl-ACP synthase n=1 Tax=Rhizobium mesoamericanum TaxID=1079800 RepID=UPI0027828755|nr:beta-ketoacyl-ACP synthase [Rhizobium mesoamericanum]MDQ0558606.1 3-oxoacyl-[acyl-carrier-protein] synthase II [Rhizobium mesoamericanum]
MSKAQNDVVITGVGIVTCQGVGKEPHIALLNAESAPPTIVELEKFKPYPVHPLPDIDWSQQIAKRGDQRQMENWQRIGVFAAGLALDDAGFKDDAEACGTMDMIVAAGGGERDINVDTLIVDEGLKRNDREVLLNEKLTTELRPTLFLAQLSNLLAGNISIVHKVTGSSRTFMGEESAGISSVETAFHRIKSGESTHALVGGAYSAERLDMVLLFEAINVYSREEWQPLWSRDNGGVISGSLGAFLVLESRAHAQARGAHIYASITSIEGDRGSRDPGKLEKRLERLLETASDLPSESTAIFSGSTGIPDLAGREKAVLESHLPGAAIRGFGGVTGHGLEAHFTLGLALAALSVDSQAKVPVFDPANEKPMAAATKAAIVTTVGHQRGEGVAVLSAEA